MNLGERKTFTIVFIILHISALLTASYFTLYGLKTGNSHDVHDLPVDQNEVLRNSVISGADFLVRMQNLDGSYKYMYYPESNTYSTENNILRHTGVVYSLLLVYEYTEDTKYLECAERGIDFLMNYIEYKDSETAYILFNDKAKLGGAALAAIALSKHEELRKTGQYYEPIEHLINFLLHMQEGSGKFTSFYIYNGEYVSPSDSQIYPGEAVLALIRAYRLLKNEDYLSAMDRAYSYYSVEFAADPSTAFTSWTTTAYVELYNVIPERKYAEFVFLMQDWLTSEQYTENMSDIRYLGGYGPGTPTVSAGSKTEGVADAYLLAKKLNDEERAAQYKRSMMLAAEFLVRLQFTEEITSIHPDPDVAIGAFFHHFGEYTARVDYTQHCISAIVKALTYK
jgi:hypothetical protein